MSKIACFDSVKRNGSNTRPTVKNTHMVFCIDVSGSMGQFSSSNMLDSINKLINEQRINSNVLIKNYITVIKFGTEVSFVKSKTDINDLFKIEYSDIVPNGTTSLYDAIGLGISQLSDDEDNMFMILTDGMENSSNKETIESVRQMLGEVISKKYLVKYLGGGSDAVRIGKYMGFPEDCCLSFTNSDDGFKNALNSMSSISRHRTNESHAFTGLERVKSISSNSNLKVPAFNMLKRVPAFNMLKRV